MSFTLVVWPSFLLSKELLSTVESKKALLARLAD